MKAPITAVVARGPEPPSWATAIDAATNGNAVARQRSRETGLTEMDLSPTASRFDNSISWLAAVGDEAALAAFNQFGAQSVYDRNRELEETLRSSLTEIGWHPVDLPEANRSTIVAVPLADLDPYAVVEQLSRRGIVCSTRDGNLRFAIHLYNHRDDVDRLVDGLSGLRRPAPG